VHRRLVAFAPAAILALGACGGSDNDSNEAASSNNGSAENGGGDGFPQTVVDNYMKGCTSGGQATEEYCQCSLEQLEKTLSLEEFVDLEQEFTANGELPKEIEDAVTACVDKL
jgi:hypothetical protein